MNKIILIREIVLILLFSCFCLESFSQTNSLVTWKNLYSKGELRLLSLNDAKLFINTSNSEKERIIKVWVSQFDSIEQIIDEIVNSLQLSRKIKEIRLARFTINGLNNSKLMNRFLLLPYDSLKTLEIQLSDFKYFDDNIVEKLSNLEHLNLSDNNITDVNKVLSQLIHLKKVTYLDFYNNPIRQIPNDGSVYGALKTIGLGFTLLEDIPCELFYSTGITTFGVFHTKIKKIPKCALGANKCLLFNPDRILLRNNKKIINKLKEKCGHGK